MLYLLPNVLGEEADHSSVLPVSVDRAVSTLDHLIAESEKEGRRFLKRFTFVDKTFREIPIHLLNEHTTQEQKEQLLEAIVKGQTWGLVSDCGMPCLADPGEELVLCARERGVAIQAFVGPSSILLALILSGLGGQHFCFRGYLPREEAMRIKEIKEMQLLSRDKRFTFLFIEAPYRNEKLFKELLVHLEDSTWLCVASELTLPSERVITHKVKQWKKDAIPSIDRRPTVFVVRA